MACSEKVKLILFAAYLISIVSALANPANLNYEDAYHLTQGANIVTLVLLAYCKGSWNEAFIAAVLALAFTFRATGVWRGGSRWDSLLVTVGMLVILQQAFYAVVPKTVGHRRLLYLGFSLMVMPVLSALPHLINPPAVEDGVLLKARECSGLAYSLPKGNGAPPPPTEWMAYQPETDATVGMRSMPNDHGGTDIYIFFAGSESTQDWKNNINILGSAIPPSWGCASTKPLRTHLGYTKAFTSIAEPMRAALEAKLAAAAPVHRVVICGHSMGGAMATMASLYVTCAMPQVRDNVCCVTFGAPQVGDSNFVAYFNEVVPTCVRVVNPMDPVPRLLNIQFVHVKGYYPVGTFWIENLLDAHNVYHEAMAMSPIARVIASVVPAVVAASAIGLYIAMHTGRLAD